MAQTYTTQSKSCGSCSREVSIHSKVGDYCPHCGVRWGYENERRTTSYGKQASYDTYVGTTQMVYSNTNLRERPSTKSSILTKMPSYSSVKIISKTGSWYYVEYEFYDDNWSMYRTIKGYLHRSLIK